MKKSHAYGGDHGFDINFTFSKCFFPTQFKKMFNKIYKKNDKMTAFVIHKSGGICNLQRNVNPIYTEQSLWKKRI